MLPLTAVAGKYTTCAVQSVHFLSSLRSLILPCVLHFPKKPFSKPQRARLDIPVQTCIHAGESAWRGTTMRARKLVFPLVSPEEHKKKKKKVGFFTQMPDILHCGLWGWAMGGESVRWSTSCTTDYSLVCLVNKGAKKWLLKEALLEDWNLIVAAALNSATATKSWGIFFPQHSWRICFSHFLFSVGWENGHHSHVCALSITLWPAFLNFRWLSTNKNIFYCYLPFLPIDLHESDTLALQRYQTLYVLWGLLGYLDIWASVCHVTEE